MHAHVRLPPSRLDAAWVQYMVERMDKIEYVAKDHYVSLDRLEERLRKVEEQLARPQQTVVGRRDPLRGMVAERATEQAPVTVGQFAFEPHAEFCTCHECTQRAVDAAAATLAGKAGR
jgi:hypothetical protein